MAYPHLYPYLQGGLEIKIAIRIEIEKAGD